MLIPLLELDFELATPAGERLADALAALPASTRACGGRARRFTSRRDRAHHNPRVLLVVDVGNTQTHFGAFRDGELVEHWRFATERESTSDQLGAALRNLLALRGLGFADIDASIVSSTVPELAPEWAEMARRYLGHEMLVVGPGVKTGMPIRFDNPRELGADRLVNAVAAWARFGGACIVVDFGTAITYDVVSADGRVSRRQLISPGIEISLEALSERGARLPQVDLARRARDRQHDRRGPRGRRLRLRGADRRDPQADLRRAHARPHVVATGGLAPLVVPFTEEIEEVDDLLTLAGLRLLYERNRPEEADS